MRILALDVGGTKFSIAAFDGERMIRRESRATDKQGGREWMVEQVTGIARQWHTELGFEGCGIGFGGPVDFARQRVARSTHVGGWQDFDLPGCLQERLALPVIMDNDANAGALGEATCGAGKGLLTVVLHDAVHRRRRRHLFRRLDLARSRFLCG